ncbi:RES domain-containing protein [Mycobacterium sp. URHB0021]
MLGAPFGHRFDDVEERTRTLYLAEAPETCLREVLAAAAKSASVAKVDTRRRRYGCAGAEESTADMLRLRGGVASLLNADGVGVTGLLSR